MAILGGEIIDCREGKPGSYIIELEIPAASLTGIVGYLQRKSPGMKKVGAVLLVAINQQGTDSGVLDELLKMAADYEKAANEQGDREMAYRHSVDRFNFGSQEDYSISLPMFKANSVARAVTELLIQFLRVAKIL